MTVVFIAGHVSICCVVCGFGGSCYPRNDSRDEHNERDAAVRAVAHKDVLTEQRYRTILHGGDN